MENNTILEVKDITKAFQANVVLKKINFDIQKGEVHAIIGENGAGKSTLINIIGGILQPNDGEIYLEGTKVSFKTPIQATASGISIVHQELSLMSNLSVAENVFLLNETANKFGIIDMAAMVNGTKEACKKVGIEIDPKVLVGQLSVAKQQIVEIAKAIATNAKILIMDEPTSSLSLVEIKQLFILINELKKTGVSIVFISHKLSEIMEIADRVSVLRDGILISTKNVIDTSSEDIIKDMVGRKMNNLYPAKAKKIGNKIFEVKDASRFGFFKDVSFSLRKNEILGFSGLIGAGRSETMRAIVGIDKLEEGEIYLEGNKVKFKSPRKAIKSGVCYVTEDRKEEGLFLDFTTKLNVGSSGLKDFTNKGDMLSNTKLEKHYIEMAKEMDVLPKNQPNINVLNLSGGNQQKVLMAKWIGVNPKVLIIDEPTRGVDVGAKALIHRKLREIADGGVSIILISSELPEVIGLSDRIAVFAEGHLVTVLDNDKNQVTQEEIMSNATV